MKNINDKSKSEIAKLIFNMGKRKEKKSTKSIAVKLDRLRDELEMNAIERGEIDSCGAYLLEIPQHIQNEKQKRQARINAQNNGFRIN